MHTLNIDIETFSSIDLSKAGVYAYAESPDFEILMIAYSLNKGPVKIIDIAGKGEYIHPEFEDALFNVHYKKLAFNANFERVCLAKHYMQKMYPHQWECTMVKASMLGYPLSLEKVAEVIGGSEQKNKEGKALIRYFSMPCKPTGANGFRTRNLPKHDVVKWEKYKSYCIQDVKTEMSIGEKIAFFTIPPMEKKLWVLDQHINDKGILIDKRFIRNAVEFDLKYKATQTARAVELTGLSNPNSVAQLKEWINRELLEEDQVATLKKDDIPVLLKNTDCEVVTEVLKLRQRMSKTSVKKYIKMLQAVCKDGRIRGLFQFYGANRTGRWAGRSVQLQNLPQNKIKDLELARDLVANGTLADFELLFFDVPGILSELIRTSFVAPPGKLFRVSDFRAIEARVIAWLAGEKWRLEVFATHGKIYEASASQMFKVPIESIGEGSELRQRGKVAELALGFQGGVNAMIKMDTQKKLKPEELPALVKMWRQASPRIVQFWGTCQDAAVKAIQGDPQRIQYGITFTVQNNILYIGLPSGRKLSYLRPKLAPGKYEGQLGITYEGMNQTTKQWGKQDTYGGKLVENIVQAIARDCLAYSMLRLQDEGFNLVMHVHDEIVVEEEYGKGSLEQITAIMSEPLPWAPGLLLKAAGYETEFYKKD